MLRLAAARRRAGAPLVCAALSLVFASAIVGGLRCGRLRALAAVQRVVEREPVVAFVNRCTGACERAFGSGDLVVRVLVGPRGPRRFNGALRLLDFDLRRIVATREGHGCCGEDECQTQTPPAEKHRDSIPAAFGPFALSDE